MVLYIHKSCFLTPASDEVDGFKLWPDPSEEDLSLRDQEIADLLYHTRLLALTVALPCSTFSEGEGLCNVVNDLTRKLFPKHFDQDKIQRE